MSDATPQSIVANAFIKNLLSPKSTGRLILFLGDDSTIDSIGEVFNGSGHEELVEEVLGDLSKDEIKDLFRPMIADALRRTLSAQSVDIVW